jgi:hypothetical protein
MVASELLLLIQPLTSPQNLSGLSLWPVLAIDQAGMTGHRTKYSTTEGQWSKKHVYLNDKLNQKTFLY